MLAVIENRPWLPRYRATIMNDDGKVIEVRQFWSLKRARTWVTEWTVDLYEEGS